MKKESTIEQGQGRLVYGIHAVKELLQFHPEKIHKLFVQEHQNLPASHVLLPFLTLAQKANIPVIHKNKLELNHLCPGTHQGIVALCDEFSYLSLEELIQQTQTNSPTGFLMALDGVTDPQNLGTLLRSLYALGGNGLILPQDRSALITPAAIKAAAGATEHIPVAKVKNLARSLETLKENGYWVYGASLNKTAVSPWKHDFKRQTVIVLGSEGKGLRPLILECCDGHICIPMVGENTSLNVAISGAILLYEALRQKNVKP